MVLLMREMVVELVLDYVIILNMQRLKKKIVIDQKEYHTVYEAKNGLGPSPIRTEKGWLHLAHGVRNTAAGLRYVLYMFMTDLRDPYKDDS